MQLINLKLHSHYIKIAVPDQVFVAMQDAVKKNIAQLKG